MTRTSDDVSSNLPEAVPTATAVLSAHSPPEGVMPMHVVRQTVSYSLQHHCIAEASARDHSLPKHHLAATLQVQQPAASPLLHPNRCNESTTRAVPSLLCRCGCFCHWTLQVSTNVLSTRPVLQGLQAMPSVPMAQELVHGQEPQPTTYLDMPAVQKV